MRDYQEKISDLVNVCYSYYIYGETQTEIAHRMGVSRAKVCKMISNAQDLGIVHIQINDPLDQINKLQDQLKSRFSLKEARIVPIPPFGADSILSRLGKAAAELIATFIHSGDIIGISGGNTLYEMVEYFLPPPNSKNIVVVPLLGGYGEFEGTTHGSEIASKFSKKLDAQLVTMPTPGIVNHEEKEVFRSNIMIKRSMSWIPKCNIAIFGIGTADTTGTFYKGGVLTKASLAELQKENAVGCICLNFYDSSGKQCTSFNSKIIGVTLDDISRIQLSIGVAGGSPEKVRAIQGALNGGYLDILITDQITAQELLKSPS
jgi:deoxyribonucleoside regulator